MSKHFIKYSIGIDVSKDSLSICSRKLTADLSKEFEFIDDQSNDATGYNRLHKWMISIMEEGIPPLELLEATGVYHEALAIYLR